MRKLLNVSLLRSIIYNGLVLSLVIVADTALAQDATPAGEEYSFTLKESVDYALSHQTNVLNARLDEDIARKTVKETTGMGLPQINGSVEFNDFLQRPTQLLPGDFFGQPGKFIPVQFGTKYNATVGVSASQLLFDGTYIVGLKAAKTYVDLSRKNTQRSELEVTANVTKAYYTVLVSQKRLGTIDANLQRLEKTLKDTRAMNEQGFVEKLDVDRLTVTVNNLKVEREKLQNLIDITNNLLKFQIGMPVEAKLVLTDSLVGEKDFPKPGLNPEVNYSQRVEYSLLQTQKALNALDLQRYKAGYLPSLAMFGTLSTMAQRQEFDFFDPQGQWFATGIIGARLTVPIFDGLQKSARVQKAKLNMMKTAYTISNFENTIQMQVNQANLQYANNYQTLETQRKNLELAKEVSRVTQIKYEQGVGSNLEVVTAEASLKETQANYFGALYDLLISQVDLEIATGTLISR